MLISEFNALSLDNKKKLVFGEGKLIGIFHDLTVKKGFHYKLNGLNVDVIYDKVRNILLDIIAWENAVERATFLR